LEGSENEELDECEALDRFHLIQAPHSSRDSFSNRASSDFERQRKFSEFDIWREKEKKIILVFLAGFCVFRCDSGEEGENFSLFCSVLSSVSKSGKIEEEFFHYPSSIPFKNGDELS